MAWSFVGCVILCVGLFAVNAAVPSAAVSVEMFESINQETGVGLYYWDAVNKRFVNVHKRLPVMEAMFIRMFRRVGKLEQEVANLKLENLFRIARLEVIVRKVHPGEQGFSGP